MQEKYPHKILIVEDETAMVNSLVDNLKAAGFGHIMQAKNGEEGLARAISDKPDLVILDIVMPKMDGMTMLRNLRAHPAGKDIKVILLTNLAADDAIMRGIMRDTPTFYLVKAEFSIDEAVQKVKDALGVQ
jgi:two-component system alkaline phosphatase synthesis response regulator PhoP